MKLAWFFITLWPFFAHAALLGVVTERHSVGQVYQEVQFEAVGDGRSITVSFVGFVACPTALSPFIWDAPSKSGDPVPFANFSFAHIDLGLRQAPDCVRAQPTGSATRMSLTFDLLRDAQFINGTLERGTVDPDVPPQLRAAFERGDLTIGIVIQVSHGEGDGVLRNVLTVRHADLEQVAMIYRTLTVLNGVRPN